MSVDVVRSICFCDERLREMGRDTFRWSYKCNGWYFTDVPTRTMSPRARFYAFIDRDEFEHQDHRGEVYVYECCPWCGHDLPGIVEGEQRPPFDQADGEAGG